MSLKENPADISLAVEDIEIVVAPRPRMDVRLSARCRSRARSDAGAVRALAFNIAATMRCWALVKSIPPSYNEIGASETRPLYEARCVLINAMFLAHHIRRILRALWNWMIEQGEELRPDKNPGRARVTLQEKWQTDDDKPALAPRDFSAWFAEWRKLPSMNRAYHLTGLLTGARPGELARTKWTTCPLPTIRTGSASLDRSRLAERK